MTRSDDAGRDSRAQDEPISILVAAIRRINATLDLDTELDEVVESACVLTGARYGVIAIFDEEGTPQDPVFSGLTPEEQRDQLAWPGNAPLFEHLRSVAGPVRSADSRATSARSASTSPGRSPRPSRACRCATWRARADLEALVETSPVGVVVFDAKSGRPVSFNREMRRIVETLRMPGHPPEQLLEVLSFRRADGSVVSLSEFPLAQQLQTCDCLCAEEMVLSVPDGRSVKTLVDAAPAPAEGGDVGSVVVTVQDLAPLEEIERLRTEFLGLVSHELREPLAAIKGSAVTLLEEAPALDPAEMREFHRFIVEQADHMRGLVGDLLHAGRIEAGTLSVTPEALATADLVERARNTFLSGGARHAVVVDLPQVMADRQRIVQVLNNLLANAARHAPESSAIRVSAVRDDAHVAISVSDEGLGPSAGAAAAAFRKHAAPGGGGREDKTPGHGLGLAICKGLVEAHGGRIRAESAGAGRGTTVVFTVPVADEAGDQPPGAPPRPSRPHHGGDECSRILVVDDDPRILRPLREALTAEGYAPVVTGDHSELAHIPREEQPALGLLAVVLRRRHRADAADSRTLRPAGHLHLWLRPRRDPRESLRRRCRRLHRQAVLADQARRTGAGDATQARAARAVRDRCARDRLRELPRLGGGPCGGPHRDEFKLRRVLSLDARRVLPYGMLLRQVWGRRERGGANRVRVFVRSLRRKLGEDAERPRLDLQRARRGTPHAGSGRAMTLSTSSAVQERPADDRPSSGSGGRSRAGRPDPPGARVAGAGLPPQRGVGGPSWDGREAGLRRCGATRWPTAWVRTGCTARRSCRLGGGLRAAGGRPIRRDAARRVDDLVARPGLPVRLRPRGARAAEAALRAGRRGVASGEVNGTRDQQRVPRTGHSGVVGGATGGHVAATV